MRRRGLQRDINGGARAGIAARISDDVFDRAGRATPRRRARSPRRSAARAPPGRSDAPRSRCRWPRTARCRTDRSPRLIAGRSLSARARVRSWPIISFIRVPSASMRLRCFSASGPAFRRASSTATCSRASGDRSSCEMSESSCFCEETSRCSRSAIASKSRTTSPISSRRGRTIAPARARKIAGSQPPARLAHALERRGEMTREKETHDGGHDDGGNEHRRGDEHGRGPGGGGG